MIDLLGRVVMSRKSTGVAALGAVLVVLSTAASYSQVPEGYYASVIGLVGEDLKRELHNVIDNHRALPYSVTHDAMTRLDEDPDNSENVVLMYSRASVPKDTWPEFNREHLWPQSFGAHRHPAKSDLHQIFAADARVNSARKNKWFNDCSVDCRTHAKAELALYNRDSWEPPDGVKGDIARALFYMDVRYEGDSNEPNLVLTDDTPREGCDCMGQLETLLGWHRLDPVDERERRRNNLIFSEVQGNRNPFIDHPEWVASIWGAPAKPILESAADDIVTVCSFNIQFLGNSRDRDDVALAAILEDCDIAVIQELVSPPYPGRFPDGSDYNPDPESAEFFDEMTVLGFDYVLSEEDTGTGDQIHRNGSSTEWWVAFFDPESVGCAPDLPGGFLADDRSNHPDYERVPYGFPFRTVDENFDFVLISVHLKPGASRASADRRSHELGAIANWIADHDVAERDFMIVGDMNIEDCGELASATPGGFASLNDACHQTNTTLSRPRPYDHVMIDPNATTEVDLEFDFRVMNLIDAMKPQWRRTAPFPGDPYDHDLFRRYYSDHHPIVVRFDIPETDDD